MKAVLVLLLSCARPVPSPPRLPDPQAPDAFFQAEAEARARVPDPARGGPPVHPSASPLPPFTGVSRASATYVGASACGACHAKILADWQKTKHAHAVATLEEAGRAFDPGCLRCHVTGLGHPGGFTAHGQGRGEVQCEACHGPGSDHLAAPGAGYGELPRDGSACVACHTHDQSPDFAWESHWPPIGHSL